MFSFALLGCAQPSARERVCTGEIVRVQAIAGAHFSLAKGEKPLTVLVLRMAASDRARTEVICISVLDIYSAEVYGEVGDRVTFTWPEKQPLDDVWFEQLRNYHVLGRRVSN